MVRRARTRALAVAVMCAIGGLPSVVGAQPASAAEPAPADPARSADAAAPGAPVDAAPAAGPGLRPSSSAPTAAGSATTAAPEPAAATEDGETAPREPAASPGWWQELRSVVSKDALKTGLRVLLGVLLFLGGWLLSKLISYLVYRALRRSTLRARLTDKLGLDRPGEGDEVAALNKRAVDRLAARVVYYVLMLLVAVGVLQYAGLTQAAGPIEMFLDKVALAFPVIAKAVLILVVAYLAGVALKAMVTRALDRLGVDRRFAELSTPREGEDDTAAPELRPFSENAGHVTFWLVVVVGLAGAFDALEIRPLADPLRNAIDRVVQLLPSIGIATLLVIAGYVVGRIARAVAHNLLHAAGFDALVEQLKLHKLFGKSGPSAVAGVIAMALIIAHAAIAALDELGLDTLSQPLTEMMAQLWILLPVVAVSGLIIVVGVVVGRIVRDLVESGLENLGLDDLMERLGLGEIRTESERAHKPSGIVALTAYVGVILVAIVQALENLDLHIWSEYLDTLLSYTVRRGAVALVIVTVGVAIGTYVRDVIRARSRSDNDEGMRWIAAFARYSIIVFAFTMAVHHLDVGQNFVLISFSLLFGSLCLALALAFGLGPREVAADIVRKQYARAKRLATQPGAEGATDDAPSAPDPGSSPAGTAEE